MTAGVLRGERARFQLFGDTVNTAARMESNGVPGKIHASTATADLLVAAGMSSWVIPREGGVQAKGKGLMKTVWLHPVVDRSNSVSTFQTQGMNSSSRGSHNVVDLEHGSVHPGDPSTSQTAENSGNLSSSGTESAGSAFLSRMGSLTQVEV